MTNSNQKGKRGEREFAASLRGLGLKARRTQQFSGTEGTADVSSSLDGVHLEVKRYARIAAFRFLEQAERDSNPEDLPVVAMREDRGEWAIMFKLKHLERMASTIVEGLEMSRATSASSPSSSPDGIDEDDSDRSRSTN